MESNLDVWGEAALAQPNGASYEFFAPLLPPPRYVNADYGEPCQKIPPDILGRPQDSQCGIYGKHDRRQLAFGSKYLTLPEAILCLYESPGLTPALGRAFSAGESSLRTPDPAPWKMKACARSLNPARRVAGPGLHGFRAL